MTALWLLACGTPATLPSPPPPQKPEDCARYEDPNITAYCITGLVRRGQAELSACGDLGEQTPDCQSAWVLHALGQGTGTREELLAACPGAPDCALSVLDARPDHDVSRQLAACRAHTGPYAEDCTVHALQRWAANSPGEADFTRVAAETDHPAAVGALLGLVVACQQVGSCAQVSAAARAACDQAVEQDIPARPEICQLLQERR